MKQPLLLAISLTLICITGCQKSGVEPKDNTLALREQLQGDYKLLSANSSEAVDMNRDGIVSTDLLSEVQNLGNSEVEIRIIEKTRMLLGGGHLFTQWWQRPYVSPGSPGVPVTLSFANQAAPEYFTFDSGSNSFSILPREKPDPDFPAPESVVVVANDELTIVSKLPVYSSTLGIHLAKVTARYKRYR